MMTEEELKRFRDYANHYQGSDVFLLMNHIDEQASQIVTLKTALLKDRFWLIWKGGECASVEKATAKAEHQLATEYPDIVWEERK